MSDILGGRGILCLLCCFLSFNIYVSAQIKITGCNVGCSAQSKVVDVDTPSPFGNINAQSNFTVEFDMMDFVHPEDYKAYNSAMAIDLNAVLSRIFDKLYTYDPYGTQTMSVKFPETHFGTTSFFVDAPITIPHGVTVDLSHARVFVCEDFKKNKATGGFSGDNFVFAFGNNGSDRAHISAKIKNVNVMVSSKLVTSADCPDVIFNLTNFSGVMENVEIDLMNSLKIVAIWQPYGTPRQSYSDMKIIRRCRVRHYGRRNDTPTVLLCMGDGCIIEQSILGYVAILGGNSYAIRGCLNDSYFLYDTSVDFSGSYWEIGQFKILDSKVRFASGKLDIANNNFGILGDYDWHFIGPWMAVDTEGCRTMLKHMVRNLDLGKENFNQITPPAQWGVNNPKKFLGHATCQSSTVTFDPTLRSEWVYWGYRQPMSGPLLKVGPRARIIGLENLESVPRIYLTNPMSASDYTSAENKSKAISVRNPATIPLLNGDFFDLKRDVVCPDKDDVKVSVRTRRNAVPKDKKKTTGCDWSGDEFSDFTLRFVLDRQRNLYSDPFIANEKAIQPEDGSELIVSATVDMNKLQYSNLMCELSFNRKGMPYVMRQHFSRIVDGDIVSFGASDITPSTPDNVTIAQFTIAKVYADRATILKDIYTRGGMEKTECLDDFPQSNAGVTLSDYCGNMYEPNSNYPTRITVATKVARIGENNVRAYLSAKQSPPDPAAWNDGDQIVIDDRILMLVNGKWREI